MVRMKDADVSRVGKGIAAVREVLRERLTRKQITRQEMADQMLLVGGTIDYSGFDNVDLVIEAVFEDLAVKHAVVREVEDVIPGHAIVASNTSTIPIARIAEASSRPERLLGMHFFSPVSRMPLLEVIPTSHTRQDVIGTAVAWGRAIGKTVIVVNDAPGFYVNRILAPYLNEAGALLDAGATIEAVDEAMEKFGFPVGPFTLLDEVGLDIASKSGTILYESFGERMAPSQSMRAVINAGRFGRKGKLGFYQYDAEGKKGDVDTSVYALLPNPTRSSFTAKKSSSAARLHSQTKRPGHWKRELSDRPGMATLAPSLGSGFHPFEADPSVGWMPWEREDCFSTRRSQRSIRAAVYAL
jgi:3-hydroxyacyl-CoA dehydrogenase/enoyl-CoA hydratase/3-hydroxybutyryl-CoA epimerase